MRFEIKEVALTLKIDYGQILPQLPVQGLKLTSEA